MENSIINKCLDILKKDTIKKELKIIARPLFEIVIEQLYPYLFIISIFIIINFLLLLGIFFKIFKHNRHSII